MRWAKAAALLGLARELASSAEGMTLDGMAAHAEVDRRTAERMRDALLVVFPQMEELPDGRAKRFRIRGGLDPFTAVPTADELAELEAAARGLALTGADARAALLRSLSGKVRSHLKGEMRGRIGPDLEALLAAEGLAMQAGPRPVVPAGTLLTLRTALKAGSTCRFRYGGRARAVDAWGLLFGRITYLVGPSAGRDEPVLWRLDRMEEVVLGDAGRGAPEGFDLGAYAARSFGVYQEDPEDVVLRFAPSAAADARRFLFHPTQAGADEADGSFLIRFRAGGLQELAHHLFTWGDALEIVAPERLRAEMVGRLRAALARHGPAAPTA